MKKTIILLSFLFWTKFVQAQNVQTITIQPITVGNLGQYSANAINIVPRPISNIASDTTITVDCYLVNITASGTTQVPAEWGMFTVTLSFPMASSRNSLLVTWRNAILTYPNPDLILR